MAVQKERRTLDTKRLDLDAAKSRLKRAKSQQAKESVSRLCVDIGYSVFCVNVVIL